jgi:hypothetical protein
VPFAVVRDEGLDEEQAGLVADMRSELDDAEIAELTTGVALSHGFSKLPITLGLEPEEMATIVARTPDVPS